jgi:HD superfamily phosphodiesterase
MYDDVFEVLEPLLLRLARVSQERRFHPEGDALYHSLQVFQLAEAAGADPVMLAAALFHDLGKAVAGEDHPAAGAGLLEGVARPEVGWLVQHHLDLLRCPKETRALLRGDPRLSQLEGLRVWDLGGRRREVRVPTVERALGALLEPGVAEHWLAAEAVMEDES